MAGRLSTNQRMTTQPRVRPAPVGYAPGYGFDSQIVLVPVQLPCLNGHTL